MSGLNNTIKYLVMKQSILAFLFFIPLLASAQIVGTDQNFTDVYTVDGKVVFLKEIKLNNDSIGRNYLILREWMKENYSGDPFNSSIDLDKKRHKTHVVSRVELLLPENSKGIREKIIMKYHFDSFIKDNICVMEITNINFLNNAKENKNTLPQKIKAEDIITNQAITVNDSNKETRENVKKSTLFFLNELNHSLQKVLNN